MTSTPDARDDRLLAPTRWVSTAVVPVLSAAFVILYLFPDSTMRLWGWMVCPHMSAYVMGAGYLAGAYFFTRVSRSREWHRVGVGFAATTVFSTVLLWVTLLHWGGFNHDHVSFWAWLALYTTTPVLLPVLWAKNRRTDPMTVARHDVHVPRPLRTVAGLGGAAQLGFAAWMFLWPDAAAGAWPWPVDVTTVRAISAFVAFPAVTWLWFLFESRWSCFRITQQTATLGLTLVTLGALLARAEFRSAERYWLYITLVAGTLVLNVTLYVAMERRARQAAGRTPPDGSPSPWTGSRNWPGQRQEEEHEWSTVNADASLVGRRGARRVRVARRRRRWCGVGGAGFGQRALQGAELERPRLHLHHGGLPQRERERPDQGRLLVHGDERAPHQRHTLDGCHRDDR